MKFNSQMIQCLLVGMSPPIHLLCTSISVNMHAKYAIIFRKSENNFQSRVRMGLKADDTFYNKLFG